MNCTVFTPPASRNDGDAQLAPGRRQRHLRPPFTDAVVLQPLPDGAASDTAHDAPATAPVNAGDADSPFPNATVVKPDGHEPLTTSFVAACGEPDGAFTTSETRKLAGAGSLGGASPDDDDVFDLVHVVSPPVPPVKPRSTFGGERGRRAQRLRAVDPDGDRAVQCFHLHVVDAGAQVRDRAARREPVQQVGCAGGGRAVGEPDEVARGVRRSSCRCRTRPRCPECRRSRGRRRRAPRALGSALLASANVSVWPSAPVPDPIVWSNSTIEVPAFQLAC